jgi:hypothetical protein
MNLYAILLYIRAIAILFPDPFFLADCGDIRGQALVGCAVSGSRDHQEEGLIAIICQAVVGHID